MKSPTASFTLAGSDAFAGYWYQATGAARLTAPGVAVDSSTYRVQLTLPLS